jgi:uroporphyrinogen decarboxylase
MTSRERVIAALNHTEPDKIPLDLGGTTVSGIHAVAYRKLKAALNIAGGSVRVYDCAQQLALVEDQVRDVLHVDTKNVVPAKLTKWRDGIMPDGNPCLYPADFLPETLPDGSKVTRDRGGMYGDNEEGSVTLHLAPGAYYYEMPCHPLANAKSKEDIDSFPLYWQMDAETASELQKNLDMVRRSTDYAIVVETWTGGWAGNYEVFQLLRGWDNFLVDLAANPEFARYMLEVRLEAVLKRWEQMIEILGDVPQVVCIGDDLGLQDGPQISPELYRKIIKPIHQKFVSFIKSRTKSRILIHTCGSVYKLIPDLIEVGIDILNPVQVGAKDMDSRRLKKEFGKDLVFWGGIDTQHVLPFGKVADVRDEVKKRIDDFAPGGGYVFNTVHNIQYDVPIENLLAMFETFERYR